MVRVFFSYSHKNEDVRYELEKHFHVMKRTGLIGSWYDRRILPGGHLDPGIMGNLEKSQIVLLLVSHDFLASDYCYGKEMLRAMVKHNHKELVIIPVILAPCDWKHTPLGKLKALPNDGKPISKFANMNDAYLEIVKGVTEVINSKFRDSKKETTGNAVMPESMPEESEAQKESPSGDPRVKKKFSARDNNDFIIATYRHIKNYFEDSLDALQQSDSRIQADLKRIDDFQFEAVIYKDGAKASECRIWMSKDGYGQGGKDIKYSSNLSGESWNESMSMEDDGYIQFLKPIDLHFGHDRGDQFSMEGAAEYYWTIFIGPVL